MGLPAELFEDVAPEVRDDPTPMTKRRSLRRLGAWVAALVIMGLLCAPAVQWRYDILNLQREELREYRPKSKIPIVSWRGVTRLPAKLDRYLQDHFGFRDLLVQLNNSIRFHLFGVSPVDKILMGREGWLYYTGNGAIEFYRGSNLLNDRQLRRVAEVYETRRRYLEHLGIRYILLLVPNKESVYPEYLPPEITQVSEISRYDQIVQYLATHTKVEVIDAKPALLNAKGGPHPLYRKSDGHWSGLGAYVAYEELFAAMHRSFPEITKAERREFTVTRRDDVGELGRMLGLYESPRYSTWYLAPRVRDPWFDRRLEREGIGGRLVIDRARPIDGRTGLGPHLAPSALVYRDSFFAAMTPFFSRHFARSVYLTTHKFSFDPVEIEQELPALVVDQVIERYLTVPRGGELAALRARLRGVSLPELGTPIAQRALREPVREGAPLDVRFEEGEVALDNGRRHILALAVESEARARLRIWFGRVEHGYRRRDSVEVSLRSGRSMRVTSVPGRSPLMGIKVELLPDVAVGGTDKNRVDEVTVREVQTAEVRSVKKGAAVGVKD